MAHCLPSLVLTWGTHKLCGEKEAELTFENQVLFASHYKNSSLNSGVVRCTLCLCFSGLPLTWLHISFYTLWNVVFVVLVMLL